MAAPGPFSCFIIGTGSLPVECAEILLRAHHKICGVVSSDPAVRRWAIDHGIPDADSSSDCAAFLTARPFDYLFSISNLVILSPKVLSLARGLTINCHDALLPRYAGMHATSWALLHGERLHGITWHAVTDRVDAGDILKQQVVPIAEGETAFSLNLKCFEAAVGSFAELVDELGAAAVLRRAQDLSARTWFGASRKPAPGGVLTFDRPARSVDRLVRALDFGPAANPLGAAKLLVGRNALIVPEVQILDSISRSPAGTVSHVGSDVLHISTADFDVAVRKASTLEGVPIPMSELAARLGLHDSARIPALSSDLIERIEAVEQSTWRHEAYWIQRLAALEPLRLPHVKSGHGAAVSGSTEVAVTIPARPEPVTREDGGRHGALWLAGAFVAWLARIGETEHFDIGLGTPDLDGMVMGLEPLFASVVPLGVDLDIEMGVNGCAAAIAARIDAVARAATYARDIVARTPALRSMSKTLASSLPVVVRIVDPGMERIRVPGSQLTVCIAADGTACHWLYDSAHVDCETAQRVTGGFTEFLSAAVKSPDEPVARLPLLTSTERTLLHQANATRTEFPSDRCIHHLFEEQAGRIPDRPAVIFQDRQLTYSGLNGRANQLAHYLIARGVGPGVLVGIALERSLDMVVGLLGILKAGGAYVPLDPGYPAPRLRLMLEDTKPGVLLTQESCRQHLPTAETHIVCLDADWNAISREPGTNPVTGVTADDLSYVIYTSGSTGTPKGVMTPHCAVVNCLVAETIRLGLTEHDRFLSIASLSFDGSVLQLFQPLTHGGSVVLADQETTRDGRRLATLLSESGATVIDAITPSLRLLIDSGWEGTSGLTINAGGDVMERDLAEQLLDRAAAVWNAYGLTEITVESVDFRVEHGEGDVPIGRPMANSTAYVLDSRGELVPIDVPGDLYIGGIGVARGYLNLPDLTHERFLPNPYDRVEDGSVPSSPRLFKTGDRAKWLPNGNLAFLGRRDSQVKVRGFRIELGEVEHALRRQPGVRDALVVSRVDEPGESRLVAYFIPEGDAALDGVHLRRGLALVLPDFMLPSAFVELERFPISPNGKIDRRALPAPQAPTRDGVGTARTSSSATERHLAAIWERVLRVESIGLDDNFFELGGHSLLATKVFAEIASEMGRRLPIIALFRAPTIRGLARLIEQPDVHANSTLVPIQPVGSLSPFFCVHGFGGGVMDYAELARLMGTERPFYGLQGQGLDNSSEPDHHMETMAARYVRAIRSVQSDGPYYLGGYCFGGIVAFEMARQLEHAGQSVAMLAILEGYATERSEARRELFRPHGMTSFVRNLPYWLLDYGPPLLQAQFSRLSPRGKAIAATNGRLADRGARVMAVDEFRTNPAIPPGRRSIGVSHLRALEDYRLEPFAGRVTLFRVRALSLFRCSDPEMGWGRLSSRVDVRMIPGAHYNILRQPYVTHLAKELAAVLA